MLRFTPNRDRARSGADPTCYTTKSPHGWQKDAHCRRSHNLQLRPGTTKYIKKKKNLGGGCISFPEFKLPLAFLVPSAARKESWTVLWMRSLGTLNWEQMIQWRLQRIHFDGEWWGALWQGHSGSQTPTIRVRLWSVVALSALVTIFLNFFFRFLFICLFIYLLYNVYGGVPNRLIFSRHSGCIFGNVLFTLPL